MYSSNINLFNVEKLYNLDLLNKYKNKNYFSISRVKKLNLNISMNNFLSTKISNGKELNDLKIKFYFLLFLTFNSIPNIKSVNNVKSFNLVNKVNNEDFILNITLKNKNKILLFLFYFFIETKKNLELILLDQKKTTHYYTSSVPIIFFSDLFFLLNSFFSFNGIKEKTLKFSFLIKNSKTIKTFAYIQNLPFFRSNI